MNRDTIISRDAIAIAATGATLLVAVIATGTLNHHSISSLRQDVHGDIGALRQDVTALRSEVAEFRERVVRDMGTLSERIARLEVEVGTLKVDVGELKVDVGKLKGSGYES